MSKQISPFAALSGAEKQIRWMEYQSIRLPYVQADLDGAVEKKETNNESEPVKAMYPQSTKATIAPERPQPPPEVPRTMPSDFSKTNHSQYDAVIARLKQAELQARCYTSQASQ